MNAPVPLELQVWDAGDCAAYFKESRENFLRQTRHAMHFPKQLACSVGGRPKWSAKAVIEWGLK